MAKRIRISLANKCQLLFGLGVVLIVTAALFVVAMRMDHLAELGPKQRARDLAGLWISGRIEMVEQDQDSDTRGNPDIDPGMRIEVLSAREANLRADDEPFLRLAFEYFSSAEDTSEYFSPAPVERGDNTYLYARAVRLSEMGDRDPVTQSTEDPNEDPLEKLILIQVVDGEASKQRTLNLIY
ncbi:MAG: hypothetical protein AAF085_09815, partial [Planctomycetota bacterium]